MRILSLCPNHLEPGDDVSRTTVFVDLDGTLLTSELTISAGTLAAIQTFPRAADIIITTGRSAASALKIAAQLPRPVQPTIVCNGGAILDRDGTTMYVGERYSATQIETLTELASRYSGVGACFYTPTSWYTTRDDLQTTAVMRHTDGEQRVVDSLTEIAEPVVKVLFVSQDPVALARIESTIGSLAEDLNLLYSYSYCLEAMPAGVSKGAAVRWLLESRGIDVIDAFAVGDGQNDVSMLSAAGTAFAPSNAHPDALSVADHVVASNDDDGVAEALAIIAHLTEDAGPLRLGN